MTWRVGEDPYNQRPYMCNLREIAAELRRELDLRRVNYPKWIDGGADRAPPWGRDVAYSA
jgi:hypothetical protein